jgi:hypothetical protein
MGRAYIGAKGGPRRDNSAWNARQTVFCQSFKVKKRLLPIAFKHMPKARQHKRRLLMYTILIVDDEQTTRDGLTRLFGWSAASLWQEKPMAELPRLS